MAKKRFQDQEEMTSFMNFKESFEAQNRYLKISQTIFFCCFSIVIAMLVLTKEFHILEDVTSFRTELSKEEICLIGMNSIIQNRPDSKLIDKNFIAKLKEHKIHYSVSPQAYYRPYMVQKNRCKLTVKVEKGLLGFDVRIEKNGDKYKLLYAIADYDEYSVAGIEL